MPPETASTCESDWYRCNSMFLKYAGCEVEKTDNQHEFAGIKIRQYPQVTLLPSFATTLEKLKASFKGSNVITSKSSLVLKNNVSIDKLKLDGSLVIDGTQEGEPKQIKDLEFNEQNYVKFVPVCDSDPQYLQIRGYKVDNIDVIKKL